MTFQPATDLDACNQKVKRLTSCIEIANLINSELAIDKLLTHYMESTKQVFSADSVSLLLKDENTGDLIFYIALDEVSDDIKEIFRVKKGQGIAGHVAQTGRPLNLKDVYEHPRFSREYDRITGYKTRAMLCVPLKTHGRILGVIQVMNKTVSPYHFTSEELDMLITISSSAAVAIETARLHKEIIRKKTLDRDLKLARVVQQSFLPAAPPDIPGFAFAGLNQPALEIGGDFYNFFHLQDNRLGIVLGDVSGKGISASLFMARLTSDLQYHALLYPEPCRLLEQLNIILCARAQQGMFVTLVYMVLDLCGKHVVMANAGHLPPIFSRGKKSRLLCDNTAKGLPLGIIPEAGYTQKTWSLEPGDIITLCTDGITEAKTASGELFGVERLMAVMDQHPCQEPEARVQGIIDAVNTFSRGNPIGDDLTLLSFQVQ